MNKTEVARIAMGKELFIDHLTQITEQAKIFLGALKGFRRDLATSVEAMPNYIRAEFVENAHMIVVPELVDGMSFADFADMCALCEDALDGSIRFKNPPEAPDQKEKKALREEMMLVHQNLIDVSDTAHRLYQMIAQAGFEFDVFNSKNNDVDFHEADVLFNRDALNVSMSTSRALSERAVRLDIDVMEAVHRLSVGEPQL